MFDGELRTAIHPREISMPRIIVTADPVSSELTGKTPVLLDEHVHSVHLSTDHAAAQLVERLAWAVGDAETAERARVERHAPGPADEDSQISAPLERASPAQCIASRVPGRPVEERKRRRNASPRCIYGLSASGQAKPQKAAARQPQRSVADVLQLLAGPRLSVHRE
jgi:hypothetical protein